MNTFDVPLTPTAAEAAARHYHWDITPHDNGGFFAQTGQHRLTVVFAEDRTFVAAHISEGINGMLMSLRQGEVIGTLARHGHHAAVVWQTEDRRNP